MFGIKLESDKFFQQIAELISRLDEAHTLTVLIGVVCMVTLFLIWASNFGLRCANGPLRELLAVTGLTEPLGKENIHVSVRGAVAAYRVAGDRKFQRNLPWREGDPLYHP